MCVGVCVCVCVCVGFFLGRSNTFLSFLLFMMEGGYCLSVGDSVCVGVFFLSVSRKIRTLLAGELIFFIQQHLFLRVAYGILIEGRWHSTTFSYPPHF